MVRYSTLGCWRHCLRFPILTLTMCITVRNKYHKFVTGNGANNNDYTPSQPPLRPYTPLLSVPEVNRFPMEETDPLVSVTYLKLVVEHSTPTLVYHRPQQRPRHLAKSYRKDLLLYFPLKASSIET